MAAFLLNKKASSEKHCSAAGKISPSIFYLKQKTEKRWVLYKIISGSTRGNEKILIFVRMVRDWTKHGTDTISKLLKRFFQPRTIITKHSIF